MRKRSALTGLWLPLLLSLLLSSCGITWERSTSVFQWEESAPKESNTPALDSVKAMWLSQFDLYPICVQNGEQRPVADFLRLARQMMGKLTDMGINTLFVQVRPNGDSFYPSALFPMSRYAVGTAGKGAHYDPFGLLLELAHDAGLSVHAWINPLRCFTETDRAALPKNHALLNLCDGERMVEVGGVWYLNPAYDENLKLIAQGAEEILRLYGVAGIHIDDYFYPTVDPSFDRAAYTAYLDAGGRLSLADFRRERIHCLIQRLYETVHAAEGDRLFGVSPGGNTRRNYEELYADVAAWCASGIVDYLCPQIYFGLEHETVPFDRVCREFAELTAPNGVALLIGMTLEKAQKGFRGEPDPYAGSGAREWIDHRDVLSRCLSYAAELPTCAGVSFFSYRLFFSPEDGSSVAATEEERHRLIPLLLGTEFQAAFPQAPSQSSVDDFARHPLPSEYPAWARSNPVGQTAMPFESRAGSSLICDRAFP